MYLYLGSPYTHPDLAVMEQRAQAVTDFTSQLLCAGLHVYSPIVHCHEMAKRHKLPREYEFWSGYNKTMLLAGLGLGVYQLDGWKQSKGLITSEDSEYETALAYGRPIIHFDPAESVVGTVAKLQEFVRQAEELYEGRVRR